MGGISTIFNPQSVSSVQIPSCFVTLKYLNLVSSSEATNLIVFSPVKHSVVFK